MTTCDVVVIGLGPGGEATATELAKAGLDVVGVEERLVGGECPYFGCIPSKMIIRAADALAEARRVGDLAGSAEVRPDLGVVARRIREEATDDWDDQVAVDRLVDAGVRFVRGRGRLTGPRTVQVGEETFEARRGVVLNPGTSPSAPPIDGLADTPYWTNREVLRAEAAPASMAVIGGGPIGAELAQAFSRFGTRVTVLEIGPRILGPEEPEAGELLGKVFAEEGLQVLTEVEIRRVSFVDGHFSVELADQTLEVEKVLVAAGRRPNLADLGLETVGLDPSARSIEVDESMRAGDGLWAIGDVVGHGAWTHMSMYQSAVAVRDLLDQDGGRADYRAVPHVTFTDPEVGGVGMTEQQARDAGLSVRTGWQDMSANSRGWINRAQGFVKLVEDADRGVLVGATVVGPTGGDVLGMLTTAVHAEVPTATLRSMIYAYPTMHRAVEEALKDLAADD
ncbi:Pyruvate/2-oxoglutarate dehydrogenase complex, dihydrolipoamide dehydrogenase (E3) component [Nocardioides scoriae]|uniref:Pyruvate/2-oxoglutarate dehydrogenase complex, dihydrolipoamide dehydrogenase (E3) component n=1 Tax=Nocardioides scoriae TaxID=642780 RepID=A0A1H1PTL9_9ACTN|nr:NAD(P)/FAD-dependent oxidoreductase [Nocardioides scoriae]SDS14466.1 Pyruvate/2-oxoglutarate dehydrogenase complex, dihydrolipoamide dehydrogenase (E3) component [Nocardioides scoriae]